MHRRMRRQVWVWRMWSIMYWRMRMCTMMNMVNRGRVWSMGCMGYWWMRNWMWMWRVCNIMWVWWRMDWMMGRWMRKSMWIMVGDVMRLLDLWMMCSDHIWWRPNFSSWLALIRSSGLLCGDGFWEERCSITHTVTVPELPIVPFFLQPKYIDSSDFCKMKY